MAGLLDFLSGSGGGDPSQAQGGMGLMNLYANPQLAGMLGMSQGLLSASGPSRIPVSMGQAMGAGLGGMQQSAGNALQMQMQMAKMQAMMNPFGPPSGGQGAPGQMQQPQQPQQPNPAMAQGAPVSGGANVGPMSGLSAGMGGLMQPQPQGGQPQAAAAPSATDPFSAMFGGHTPQEVMIAGARAAALGNPAGPKMMEMAAQYDPSLQAMLPTDITKMGTQAGMTPAQLQAANAAGVQKATAVPIRQGGGVMVGNQITMTPGAAAPGFMNVQDPSSPSGWSSLPVQGGLNAISSSAAAQAGGKAQYQVQQVWDPAANNGQGGFVKQTTANVANAANGNAAPVGIRNNNFGNIKGSNGQFAQYDTPQAGVNAADQLLSTYGNKYGINTLSGIANRWAPQGDGNNNPAAKAAAMAAASGVGVNEPVNLADPATRARILPALFDTETPGWRNAIQGGGTASAPSGARGPMAAQPPMGAQNAANASQGAPSKQMADAYSALSGSDANYQASRTALQSMMDIANKNAPGDAVARLLPQEWATRLSDDAAEYEKAHANFISLQGKALGAGGTDASRANQAESVPDFTKPQQAKVNGLNAQLQQLDMNHLKTQFMTPVYQQGNEKTYTTQNAAFDQNVKPAMLPVLQLSGPQQQAAVQAAIKANPALRPNFEWAFNNGLLK
ncbi:hypothetical protein R75461_01128 [Paraburkholderia nemoris]|uniref:hypothetical protein n=1 Tax=Paraburkholderia nemoris TaxID=2793076 RepID=UPI001B1054EC|nr:hypothetical protein [Paraburkholderia nemoris]CAE6712622.1 hypothetical protein R75461_01128 [Paraburkholderia nemoris]